MAAREQRGRYRPLVRQAAHADLRDPSARDALESVLLTASLRCDDPRLSRRLRQQVARLGDMR